MELCVKTYNVGAQSKEDFSKFLVDIKDYVDFDNEDKNTWFNRAINCWFKGDKQQEYAFSKKDFQRSTDIYGTMLELQKKIILIWNDENNFSPIIKNKHFYIELNEDGTSIVSHLL
jgi:hypothetical protein